MKYFLLLTTALPLFAQVPQAPAPVPTPRGQGFPPRGPGAQNNAPIISGAPVAGGTFSTPSAGTQSPGAPAAGIRIEPVTVPGLTTPRAVAPVQAGRTNIPTTAGTFPVVGTNFPPNRGVVTNPALGQNIVTNSAAALPVPDLVPGFPPATGAVGSSPVVQRGTAQQPVIDYPPGTRVRPAPPPPAPHPVFPVTPAPPATKSPGPTLPR